MIGVISKGAAQSWQMENRWKQMDELKAEGFGFATEWMRKDMGICLDQARKSGARLPVAALVDQFYVAPRGARRQALGLDRGPYSASAERLAKKRSSSGPDALQLGAVHRGELGEHLAAARR